MSTPSVGSTHKFPNTFDATSIYTVKVLKVTDKRVTYQIVNGWGKGERRSMTRNQWAAKVG